MDELFNNKYRIPSARLQNWNYADEAMYFVTICTKKRLHYFGEIVVEAKGIASTSVKGRQQPKLQPTAIGKIAHAEWFKSIELRPDMNLELGEFVIMPNHIHGIIIIGRTNIIPRGVEAQCMAPLPIRKTDSAYNVKIWRP